MCCNLLRVLFLLGMAIKCPAKNNYETRMESITVIHGETESLLDFEGLKLVGRQRGINGSVYIYVDLTDELKVSFDTYSLTYGTWTPLLYNAHDVPACEYFKKFFVPYCDPASQNTNFPLTIDGYCPLQKGEYWIINGIANTDKWASYMKRGLVKLRIEAFKNGKGVGGVELVIKIDDRTS